MRKRFLVLLLIPLLLLSACGQADRSEFTETDITVEDLKDMTEAGDTFLLLVERDGCEFCQALNEYIDETKGDHPEVHVFRIDTTDFDLKKVNAEDKTLVSDNAEGKEFLEMLPYFLYTPAIYRYENGKAVEAAIGFNVSTDEISLWDVDSTIDFDTAKTEGVWEFLEK